MKTGNTNILLAVVAITLTFFVSCGGSGKPNITASTPGLAAPVITQDPLAQDVSVNDTATFTVTATGNEAPTFAWETSKDALNWVPVQNSTTLATYSVTATSAIDGTWYRAKAINSQGSVYSRAASLTVGTAPEVLCLRAEPATIHSGDGTRLSWSTRYANNLSMDNSVGTLSGKASVWVKPSSTTTYTLTARNSLNSTAKATITVTVNSTPGSKIWKGTATMKTLRTSSPLALLPNGKVLLTGGFNSGNPIDTAEIYDPLSNTWAYTQQKMSAPRAGHAARLLVDGTVMLIGGIGNNNEALASTEIYDPNTDSWSDGASLKVGRWGQSAVVLANGKVLVVGGITQGTGGANQAVLNTAEIYDPAHQSWSQASSMSVPRISHATKLLTDGRVLVSGGYSTNGTAPLASAEIYDPSDDTWSPAATMKLPRWSASSVLLPDGKVLVLGGQDGKNAAYASCETYDPATDRWTDAASMKAPRSGFGGFLLPNGIVMASGGYNPTDLYLASMEMYDPSQNSWSAGSALPQPQGSYGAVMLADGKVFVAGGASTGGFINLTEAFDY